MNPASTVLPLQVAPFPLVLFPYDIFPVLALQPANREVPVRHILKVMDEDEVDRAAADRAHHRNRFRNHFFGNRYAEPLRDYREETGQGRGHRALGGAWIAVQTQEERKTPPFDILKAELTAVHLAPDGTPTARYKIPLSTDDGEVRRPSRLGRDGRFYALVRTKRGTSVYVSP